MKLSEDGKYQEAISLLNQVKGPLSITAEFQIAQIYENDIGNYSLAIERYNDLKQKYPNSLWSEHIEKALSFLQSNVDFDGKPMNKYKRAEKLYAEQKQEEAIAMMKSVIEHSPTTKLADDVLYWVGQQYYFTQRCDEAINYLAKLIDQYQNSEYTLEAFKLLGSCYVLTKQENKAMEAYNRVLQFTLTNIERAEIEYAIERLQKEKLRRRGFYFSLILIGGIIIAYFVSSLINQKLSFHRPLFTFFIYPAITLTVTITFLYIYLYLCDLLFIFGL